MKAGSLGAVEGKPTEYHNTLDGIATVGDAGPGKVVVHKALSEEALEQTLDDRVFQVELDDRVGDDTGVAEDHRANGSGTSPFVLVDTALALFAEGVGHVFPAHADLLRERRYGVALGLAGGRVNSSRNLPAQAGELYSHSC